ncbi:hypothetical protein LCGC14_2207310, partial [marine sediment metagenome]
MDTSVKWYEDPVYIKMCDYEEIQSQRPSSIEEERCYIYCLEHKELWDYGSGGYQYCPMASCNAKGIWLPTQSQLQDMTGGFEAGFVDW